MSENLVKTIYLGIGSNLGNRRKNIEQAKFKLIQSNIKINKSSRIYESLSWPNPNNPKFWNIILEISSNLPPLKLIDICKEIEIDLGRKKREKNAPRECDIDIIDYNNQKMKSRIILPHPRMHERNFVLLPLYELNKVWIHPILKQPIKKLILSLSNKDIRSIKQI
jgi:2-amino-4-hydroxy-6-hydroxymethyldihydropteridine diphosphokinase|tara:strand:+ start:251 stop:748 length:498 start_codon:yes stop_codon:yes gene_type:complete